MAAAEAAAAEETVRSVVEEMAAEAALAGEAVARAAAEPAKATNETAAAAHQIARMAGATSLAELVDAARPAYVALHEGYSAATEILPIECAGSIACTVPTDADAEVSNASLGVDLQRTVSTDRPYSPRQRSDACRRLSTSSGLTAGSEDDASSAGMFSEDEGDALSGVDDGEVAGAATLLDDTPSWLREAEMDLYGTIAAVEADALGSSPVPAEAVLPPQSLVGPDDAVTPMLTGDVLTFDAADIAATHAEDDVPIDVVIAVDNSVGRTATLAADAGVTHLVETARPESTTAIPLIADVAVATGTIGALWASAGGGHGGADEAGEELGLTLPLETIRSSASRLMLAASEGNGPVGDGSDEALELTTALEIVISHGLVRRRWPRIASDALDRADGML